MADFDGFQNLLFDHICCCQDDYGRRQGFEPRERAILVTWKRDLYIPNKADNRGERHTCDQKTSGRLRGSLCRQCQRKHDLPDLRRQYSGETGCGHGNLVGWWVRSVRQECLYKLLIINASHLRRVRQDYIAYYNTARPHQGIQQRMPIPRPSSNATGPVYSRQVLGGYSPRLLPRGRVGGNWSWMGFLGSTA